METHVFRKGSWIAFHGIAEYTSKAVNYLRNVYFGGNCEKSIFPRRRTEQVCFHNFSKNNSEDKDMCHLKVKLFHLDIVFTLHGPTMLADRPQVWVVLYLRKHLVTGQFSLFSFSSAFHWSPLIG